MIEISKFFFIIFFSFLLFNVFYKSFQYLNISKNNIQPIRDQGPKSHLLTKAKTPTMGGIPILFSILLSSFFFLREFQEWIAIALISIFGCIGFLDDYLKIRQGNSNGLKPRYKFLSQVLASFVALFVSHLHNPISFELDFFIYSFNIGFLYLPLASVFIVTGSSNAVNLTDGLDGLVIIPVCFCLLFFAISDSQLSSLCCITIGACLGFFWYNSYPASIFMGDVGSLSLGALLGFLSIMSKTEIAFFIVGGVFVLETFSVFMQVIYFKWSGGKRLFLMAPIHHHFEKMDIHEMKIVSRFWIISFFLFLLGTFLKNV